MSLLLFILFFALGYCVGNDKLRSIITGKAKLKVNAEAKKVKHEKD